VTFLMGRGSIGVGVVAAFAGATLGLHVHSLSN